MTSECRPSCKSGLNSVSFRRGLFLVLFTGVTAAIAGGADDSISLLRRKDTGFRLLPGSPAPNAVVDLNFRAPSEGKRYSTPWLRWDHLRMPDGSAPYGWSTGSWYNYFKETTRQGVVDPGRKRNEGFIIDPQ